MLSFVCRGDRTMTGHVLGHANTRSRSLAPERNLSPVLVGITRILMHCAMIEGAHRHPQVSWSLIPSTISWKGLIISRSTGNPFLIEKTSKDENVNVELVRRLLWESTTPSLPLVHSLGIRNYLRRLKEVVSFLGVLHLICHCFWRYRCSFFCAPSAFDLSLVVIMNGSLRGIR